jgi:hypothetical protein
MSHSQILLRRPLWPVGVLAAGAVAFVFCVFATLGSLDAGDKVGSDSAPRLFELRTYTTHEGRLDALHKRFREHTCALFEKHHMTMLGFWTPTEGPEADNTLVYILAFPNREARDAAFEAFLEDPEWQAAFKASRKDGPIVKKVESRFLTPTDYSKLK